MARLLRSCWEHGVRLLHDPVGLPWLNPALDQVLEHLRRWDTGLKARNDKLLQRLLLVVLPADRGTLS